MSCKKNCPNCGFKNTKKNGIRNRRQRYLCLHCRHCWGGGKPKNNTWITEAYRKYARGRRTLGDLAEDCRCSGKTLKKYFDNHMPVTGEIKIPTRAVVVILDATFFSRHDGILVARANKKNLMWMEIETEKVEHYKNLVNNLIYAGVNISAFVIDGRRGVLQMLMREFSRIPIQFCQFHQIQIVTRYLSKRPKLEAGKELRNIALTLAKTDRKAFTDQLDSWYVKWVDFINEKTRNPKTKRWHYTHRRLRSAYRSLKANLEWLFTHLDHPELKIPNTTNSCDGSFAHWKDMLKVHRGLKKHRRQKMMNFLLENY